MVKHRHLHAYPFCVYCGIELTDKNRSVDHVPALATFDFRDRPKGLEVPSCRTCNNGFRTTDLVMAVLSRIYPDGPTIEHRNELVRLMSALNKKVPDIIVEMEPYRAASRHARRKVENQIQGGGILRLGGELTVAHIDRFGARLGFAFHFLATGAHLAECGAVVSRAFTNMDLIENEFPDEIVSALGLPSTLQAGRKNVGDQFAYSFSKTEDASMTISFVAFRQSIAFFSFSSNDPARLRVNAHDLPVIFNRVALGSVPKTEFPRIRFGRSYKGTSGD